VHLDRKTLATWTAALVATVTVASLAPACTSDDPAKPPAPAPTASGIAASTHNRVKFKGGKRIVADMASGLALETKDVCRELSTYECESIARVNLGGIEPYNLGVIQPLPERSAASMNAIDRLALSACEERAKRDFATPNTAVVFREVTAEIANEDQKKAVIHRLYTRLLGREPSSRESDVLLKFHAQLQTSEGAKANRRFATYACFAVATSEEAIFF
jgi:hypothetical protein